MHLDPAIGVPDGSEAQRSFHSMEMLSEITNSAQTIRSPRPYFCLPEEGVTGSEWIDGRNLDDVLRHASDEEAAELIKRAGSWLAVMAQASGSTLQPVEVERMSSNFDAAGHSATMLRALEVLQRTGPFVRSIPVPWYRYFGDFKPANLLVVHGELIGIDCQMHEVGCGMNDAANFLNHAALRRIGIFTSYHDRSAVRLEEAFVEGYELSNVALPRLPLMWLRLHGAIHLGLNYRLWSRPPRSWVTGFTLNRLLTYLVQSLEVMTAVAPDGSGQAAC